MKKKRLIIITTTIFIIIVVLFVFVRQDKRLDTTGPEAKLIENTGLMEFKPENDVKDTVNSEDKVMYKEILDAMDVSGNMKDKSKIQQSISTFDSLINKYPEYSDLYTMRVTYKIVLGNTDYVSMNRDLDSALKYKDSKKYDDILKSSSQIYLLKAKIDDLKGDLVSEMNDIQASIDSNPSDAIATDFFKTGGTKPDKSLNDTSLNLSDFDNLVKNYPNDYRSYLFRGIYYASFSTFDEEYYIPAITDINKAIEINSKSAESNYILGELYSKTIFWSKAGASDVSDVTGESGGYRDQTRDKSLSLFNQAVSIDPNYKYGYEGRAETNLELKNYAEAINDYTKEISLDPNDAGAYNDRAIAETYIYQYNQAIKDLLKAIQLKDSGTSSYSLNVNNSYQNIADDYSKVGDYSNAIAYYSKAIGRTFASQIFLMNLDKIRSIYPELNNISDQDLLEGLRQKYFPNMSSIDFNSQIAKNKQFDDFVLSDIYLARGDAYAKSGDLYQAKKEYIRAVKNYPQDRLTPEQQRVYEN